LTPLPNRQCHCGKKRRRSNSSIAPTAALDPLAAAKRAQLRYVSDTLPGITRHKVRNGFDYPCLTGRWCAILQQ
jgi:hypothetical protein